MYARVYIYIYKHAHTYIHTYTHQLSGCVGTFQYAKGNCGNRSTRNSVGVDHEASR